MKKILEYLPLLTICLLFFGFCNLHFYYKEFNIEIYNYINTTEIILSFLPALIFTTAIIYSFIIGEVFDKANMRENTIVNSGVEKEGKKRNVTLVTVIIIIVYFILYFGLEFILLKGFHYKEYEIKAFYWMSAYFFCLILYFYLIKDRSDSIIIANASLFSIFLFVYIGFQFQLIRSIDALKVKSGLSERKISFKYDSKIVTTSHSLIFIGQTQSNLFLYNLKDSTVTIFKTSNIDSLTVK